MKRSYRSASPRRATPETAAEPTRLLSEQVGITELESHCCCYFIIKYSPSNSPFNCGYESNQLHRSQKHDGLLGWAMWLFRKEHMRETSTLVAVETRIFCTVFFT